MDCIKCGYRGESEFYREEYECECGKMNTITYHICKNCGWMWREFNGQLSEGSEVHMDRLKEFSEVFYDDSLSADDREMFDNLQEEIDRMSRVEEGSVNMMSDYVHKCIRCREPAHEIEPGVYRCTVCGFEWEVVKFD